MLVMADDAAMLTVSRPLCVGGLKAEKTVIVSAAGLALAGAAGTAESNPAAVRSSPDTTSLSLVMAPPPASRSRHTGGFHMAIQPARAADCKLYRHRTLWQIRRRRRALRSSAGPAGTSAAAYCRPTDRRRSQGRRR